MSQRRGGRRWRRLRAELIRESSGECARCRRWHGPRPEAHHVQSVAARPDLEFHRSNVVLLCPECHAAIEKRSHGEQAARDARVTDRASEAQQGPPEPPPPQVWAL